MKKSYYIDTCIYLNLWQKEVDPKTGLKFWKIARDFLQKIEDSDTIIFFSGFVIKELSYILGNRFKDKRAIFLETIKFKKIIANSQDYDFARTLEKEFNYKLSFFDCMHIALTRKERSILITRDEDLQKYGRKYCRVYKPEAFL